MKQHYRIRSEYRFGWGEDTDENTTVTLDEIEYFAACWGTTVDELLEQCEPVDARGLSMSEDLLRCVAERLFDKGYRADDREDLIIDADITGADADIVCRHLATWELVNAIDAYLKRNYGPDAEYTREDAAADHVVEIAQATYDDHELYVCLDLGNLSSIELTEYIDDYAESSETYDVEEIVTMLSSITEAHLLAGLISICKDRYH